MPRTNGARSRCISSRGLSKGQNRATHRFHWVNFKGLANHSGSINRQRVTVPYDGTVARRFCRTIVLSHDGTTRLLLRRNATHKWDP
jgi:hypothetical protein